MEDNTWDLINVISHIIGSFLIVCVLGRYINLQAKIKGEDIIEGKVEILKSSEVFDKTNEILDFEETFSQTLSVIIDKNINFFSNFLNRDFLIISLIISLIIFLILFLFFLLIILFFLYFKNRKIKKN